MRLTVWFVMILVLAGCGEAVASRTIPSYTPALPGSGARFTFSAEEGAHPVSIRSGDWALPDSEIMVFEHENAMKIDGEAPNRRDFIRLELRAPGGAPLEAGRYPDARNHETFPNSPGILVVSGSLGCTDAFGEFIIDRIERSGDRLTGLDAGWIQSCGAADKPAFVGRVHFQV